MKLKSRKALKKIALNFFVYNEYKSKVEFYKQQEQEKQKHDPEYEEYLMDPETSWGKFLFIIGLIIEGFGIIYNVGFKLDLPGKDQVQSHLYQKINSGYFSTTLLLGALGALLVHQYYIKGTFVTINEIVKRKWKNNQYCDFFPNNLLFSWCERMFRILFFVLLSFLAGEIPYLLFVLHEISREHSKFDFISEDKLNVYYILACFVTSIIVFLWVALVLIAIISTRINNSRKRLHGLGDLEKATTLGLLRIVIFLISSFFSCTIWATIVYFMYTKNTWLIGTWLTAISLSYISIIGFRLLYKIWLVKYRAQIFEFLKSLSNQT